MTIAFRDLLASLDLSVGHADDALAEVAPHEGRVARVVEKSGGEVDPGPEGFDLGRVDPPRLLGRLQQRDVVHVLWECVREVENHRPDEKFLVGEQNILASSIPLTRGGVGVGVGSEEVVELEKLEQEDGDEGSKQVVFFVHLVFVADKIESVYKIIAPIFSFVSTKGS